MGGSGGSLRPSRFSYKSPLHYGTLPHNHAPHFHLYHQNPHGGAGNYSLPPDLSNSGSSRHRRNGRRRYGGSRRTAAEADRIECVRVKAGEIRKERISPSSLRSLSIRNSRSSDDNNSIQFDLKSLCDARSPRGGGGSITTTTTGGGDTHRLPPAASLSASEPRTPYHEPSSSARQQQGQRARTKNGDHKTSDNNNRTHPTSSSHTNNNNNKNLNVAFCKNGSKVRIDLNQPEAKTVRVGAHAQQLRQHKKSSARSRTTTAAAKSGHIGRVGGEGEEEEGWRGRAFTLFVMSLVKLVDLGLHGFMVGILLYCTYLSAVYCQQVQLQVHKFLHGSH